MRPGWLEPDDVHQLAARNAHEDRLRFHRQTLTRSRPDLLAYAETNTEANWCVPFRPSTARGLCPSRGVSWLMGADRRRSYATTSPDCGCPRVEPASSDAAT